MLGHLDILRQTVGQMERQFNSLPEPARSNCRALSAQMRKTLEPVRSGTERIASITRELGTFSQSQDEGDYVDVRSVVESVSKLMRKEVETRVCLQVTLRKSAPVLGNSARLVQVVMNLVVNALQALPGDRFETNRSAYAREAWSGTV